MSTFDGVSNCTQYNSTIGDNAKYYPKDYMDDVNETWWMKTIHELGLKLCVNNSWSGSCVSTMIDDENKAACVKRATQLHNDQCGIEPDIIILMIGGNDALKGFEVGSYGGARDIYDETTGEYIGDCRWFGQAYATMVHKVIRRYPKAKVYVCSMLHWQPKHHDKGVTQYNDMIRRIAEEFSVTYVDLYNGTPISPETKDIYLHVDGVHATKAGFTEMAKCMVEALRG